MTMTAATIDRRQRPHLHGFCNFFLSPSKWSWYLYPFWVTSGDQVGIDGFVLHLGPFRTHIWIGPED